MGTLENIRGHLPCHGIIDFTENEAEATGADLNDVSIVLFCALQVVRTKISRRIHLIFNGLTTGGHLAPEHPEGKAADFHLDAADGPVTSETIKLIVVTAIRAGFNGIGVYWNGTAYSFHLDLRPAERFAVWTGVKNRREDPWRYKTIVGSTVNLFDPQEMK